MHQKILPAISERRSTRSFDPAYEITDTEVSLILEAARLSPSGTNTQPWRFVVVRERPKISSLVESSFGQPYFANASCLIVCVADLHAKRNSAQALDQLVKDGSFDQEEAKRFLEMGIGQDPSRDAFTARRDTAIAIYGMMLQAREMDLGSCWVAVRKPKKGKPDQFREMLKIPNDLYDASDPAMGDRYLVVSMLAIGKPAHGWPNRRPRLAMRDIAFAEEWGQSLPRQ